MEPGVKEGVVKTMRLMWVGVILTGMIVILWLLLMVLRAQQRNTAPQLPVYGTVGEFTLTNLDGRVITLATLKGQPWVADIVFTRCAGPCPRMTARMKRLQDALPSTSPTRLVTLTTDPEYDTPQVMAAYARKFGANTNRWLFLTGSKPQIAKLAVDSLKLTAVEKKPEERETPEDLFIHSTIFVLVDRHGRLRGVFETEPEAGQPGVSEARILSAIKVLEREP